MPRDEKGRIYTADNLRIRPEKHKLDQGENHNPRHHNQHYPVETRRDLTKSWNRKTNVGKLEPVDYNLGEGTGFLPGEYFPELMNKQIALQGIDFSDSELDSFKFYDDNYLSIYVSSWNSKKIELRFKDVIHFTYQLGFQISNLYIGKDEKLLERALARNYEKVFLAHPYKLFCIEDIDDFPFIQVIAETVLVTKK